MFWFGFWFPFCVPVINQMLGLLLVSGGTYDSLLRLATAPLCRCCNNCADVRQAYQKKGWAFSDAKGIIQCEREGWSEQLSADADEGCNIYGFLEVNKVSGNFHIAPGRNFQQRSVHVHDLQSFGRKWFNMTHRIKSLSFGNEYPGQ